MLMVKVWLRFGECSANKTAGLRLWRQWFELKKIYNWLRLERFCDTMTAYFVLGLFLSYLYINKDPVMDAKLHV